MCFLTAPTQHRQYVVRAVMMNTSLVGLRRRAVSNINIVTKVSAAAAIRINRSDNIQLSNVSLDI